jgi:hypothetical protein
MKIFKTNDIEVYYENDLDGGGTSFGQEYIKIIRYLYNKLIYNIKGINYNKNIYNSNGALTGTNNNNYIS